jgi:hypothetical protein
MGSLQDQISQTLNHTIEELNTVWNEVGVNEEERQRELQKLLSDTLSLFSNAVEVIPQTFVFRSSSFRDTNNTRRKLATNVKRT